MNGKINWLSFFKSKNRLIIFSLAIFLMIFSLFLIFFINLNNSKITMKDEKKTLTINNSENIIVKAMQGIVNVTIPTWYLYEKLKINELTFFGTSLHEYYTYKTDEDFKYLYTQIDDKSMRYDFKTKNPESLYILTQQILLSANQINNSQSIIISKNFAYEKIFVSVPNEQINTLNFFVDIINKTYKAIPISLLGVNEEPICFNDFSKCVVMKQRMKTNDNKAFCYDIILMDFNTKATKNITQDETGKYIFDAYKNFSLSKSNKYILYSKLANDGILEQGEKTNWVVYNVKDNKSSSFTGEFLKYSINDKFIFYKKSGSYFAIDCDNGTIYTINNTLKIEGVSDSEFYEITTEVLDNNNYLNCTNMKNNSKERLVNTPISAFILDDSLQYIYIYEDKEEFISCVNIITKQSFKVPVTNLFFDEIEKSKSNNNVLYNLFFNKNTKELLITYQIQLKNIITSDSEYAATINYVNKFSDYYSCEKQGFQIERIYEGDGYSYAFVRFSSIGSPNYIFVLLEDYKNKKFYAFMHKGITDSAGFVEIASSKLSESSSIDKLKEVFLLKIKILPARINYITGQRLEDPNLEVQINNNSSNSSSDVFNFDLNRAIKMMAENSRMNFTKICYDKSEMQWFADFYNTHRQNNSYSYSISMDDFDYKIVFSNGSDNVGVFEIGQKFKNGVPAYFIKYLCSGFFITDDDFISIKNWYNSLNGKQEQGRASSN